MLGDVFEDVPSVDFTGAVSDVFFLGARGFLTFTSVLVGLANFGF